MKVLDLFCGIGGISTGFCRAGFEIALSNDMDAKVCETYRLNYPTHNLLEGDITKISERDLPSHDILAGGFPCQAFSIAGKQQGFNDCKGRGNLFLDMVRIAEYHNPRVIFMENVKNLKSHDKGRTFDIIKKTLESHGYHVKNFILNSSDFGVPQNRERIFILGFADKNDYDRFVEPNSSNHVSLDSVVDFSDQKEDKYYYTDKSQYYQMIKESLTKFDIGQIRRVYFRVNKKNQCPTLTANMGTGGHNVPLVHDEYGFRKLTPIECLGMQGFNMKTFIIPEKMGNCHIYKQAGNSVTINVIEAIAKNIMRLDK